MTINLAILVLGLAAILATVPVCAKVMRSAREPERLTFAFMIYVVTACFLASYLIMRYLTS